MNFRKLTILAILLLGICAVYTKRAEAENRWSCMNDCTQQANSCQGGCWTFYGYCSYNCSVASNQCHNACAANYPLPVSPPEN